MNVEKLLVLGPKKGKRIDPYTSSAMDGLILVSACSKCVPQITKKSYKMVEINL